MTQLINPEWSEYNHDYEKKVQDIRTADGKEFLHCWPNAGEWFVMSVNDQPNIKDEEVTHTRVSKTKNSQHENNS